MNVGGAGAIERFFGDLPLGAPVDHAEAARWIADDDIVGNRESRESATVPGRPRLSPLHLLPLAMEGHVLAAEEHSPFIGCGDPGHDFDQGRFAGAVFAEYGMNVRRIEWQYRLPSVR